MRHESWTIGVDTGGTFTDLVAVRGDGSMRHAKVPSTPPNFDQGVLDAVEAADIDLADVALFTHGTTVTTNALITRGGAKTAVVTTAGFKDVLELRRHNRDEQFDLFWDPPSPLVRGRDRLEVAERLNYAGEVVVSLDDEDVRHIARILKKREVMAVGIVYLHSYLNAQHEERTAELLRQLLPDLYVCASNEILREANEFERTATTVANAYLGPVFDAYVRGLMERLAAGGYSGPLMIMHSGGGLMPARSIINLPARTVNSGPAAGAVATSALAQRTGHRGVISFDMGGTSTDIAVISDGEPRLVNEVSPEFGLPIRFPSVDLVTIGAGGGSLAWIDPAGYPKVGPGSAGALPGPACYGHGGVEPTVTDANVVLGRLGSENLLGGSLRPQYELAEKAVATFSSALDLSVEEGALGILRLAATNMANAVRVMTVQRGLDPREFALVAFGGAGPMHAVEVAQALDIPEVIVPPAPGVLSASGLLFADVVHDYAQTFISHESELDTDQIESSFADLEGRVCAALDRDGVHRSDQRIQRQVDIRYVGQIKAITLGLQGGAFAFEALRGEFFERYEAQYRFSTQDIPLEVSALRVRGTASVARHAATANGGGWRHADELQEGARRIRFDEGWFDTPVRSRYSLRPGDTCAGPLVLEQEDTTTVLPPDVTAVVDPDLTLRVTINGAAE
jgi:N-methylhydantoinase A